MKLIAIFWFLFGNNINVPEYVIAYHSVSSKEQEKTFINTYKDSENISIQAYVVSLEMKQAKYAFFPWKKLSVFNQGKKKMEQLINKHPDNADLRYVRLVIQENIPSLLNYKKNIEEDKSFLKQRLEITDSSDYLDFYIKKNTSL
ncbi:hypothetical protein ACQY1Q_01220 [Tenacibaculum sp. TC6]|uniref:hypothetical protein n=1 Tax=Tenacibaculum sp. TC6 TaxID=3423223 RepID=UPI003D3642F7